MAQGCGLVAARASLAAWVIDIVRDDPDSGVQHNPMLLETATLSRPVGVKVAETAWDSGGEINGFSVVGDGSLLAYNTFTLSGGTTVAAAALKRVGGDDIATGLETAFAQTADKGHIAVLHWDGSVSLYPGGRTIVPATDGARSVDVSGDVVGVIGTGNKLKLYTLGGKLQKTIQLPIGANRIRLDHGRAVYTTRNDAVHLLDLASGRDRVLGRTTGVPRAPTRRRWARV